MPVVINGSTGITTPGITNSGAETIATTLAVTGATTLNSTVTFGTSALATPSGSAPSYTCRAWVNFNGIGTVAIRGSGNISSITDNGTGQYTLNFSTAMPDVNYTLGAFAQEDIGGGLRTCQGYGTPTASARPVETRNSSNALADCGWVNVIIVR